MATIYDNITALGQVKTDIKTAIEEKGVKMEKVPFTQYADKIKEIKVGSEMFLVPDGMKFQGSTLEVIKNIDTSEVKDFSRMFENCENLEYFENSIIDYTNATNVNYMFNGCENLFELNIPPDFPVDVDASNILGYCPHLIIYTCLAPIPLPNVMYLTDMLQSFTANMAAGTEYPLWWDNPVSLYDVTMFNVYYRLNIAHWKYHSDLWGESVLNSLYDYKENKENRTKPTDLTLTVDNQFYNNHLNKINIATNKGWRVLVSD